MLAYLVLLFALVSRLLPHVFHATTLSYGAWNFTAVGGGLLFFGSRLGASQTDSRAVTALKLLSAVAAMMAMDFYLTVFAFHYAFHVRSYLVTWIWYAAVCLIGMQVLSKPSFLRVAAGVLGSATSFFVVSNFVVWAGSHMYPRTLAGLRTCYTAAVPFYRNDLVSTAIVAGALFGLPALATRIVETLRAAETGSNLAG